MGLSCGCSEWDGEGEGWYPPRNISTLQTKKQKRCTSCNELIAVGSPSYMFKRFRAPKTDIEMRIYGDGAEIALAPAFMCEKCGDQFMNLDALGFCIHLGDNMFDLLEEYRENYGKT